MKMIRSIQNPDDIRGIGFIVGGDLREAALDEEIVDYEPEAPNKIIYDTAGEVLAAGAIKDVILKPGQAIEGYNGDINKIRRLDYFKRVAKGEIAEKTQAEKDQIDQAKEQG